MLSRYTTLVPFLGLHIRPACEAVLSTGMRKERSPHRTEKRNIQYLDYLFTRPDGVISITSYDQFFALYAQKIL